MGCGERRKTMELPRRKARGAPGGARWGKTGGQRPPQNIAAVEPGLTGS